MEMTTRSAAAQLGVTQRQVQRLAQSGRISHRSVAGRTVVSGRSLLAASRSATRGRPWDERTVQAACELLHGGSTDRIGGSQRSRLRARLRNTSVQQLALHVLGGRVSLWRTTQQETIPTIELADGLSSIGESLTVTVTDNASALARKRRLLEDADGDVLIVELDTRAPAIVADIALYAYGDERTSSAARQRIQAQQAAIS